MRHRTRLDVPPLTEKIALFQTHAEGFKKNEFQGATHLLSGCPSIEGVVGLAFIGQLCKAPFNIGSVLLKLTTGDAWVTLAHELGHNFGAEHSFEKCVGTTGGIMDYTNGTLDGTFQFHRKYRKDEMCKVMNTAGA